MSRSSAIIGFAAWLLSIDAGVASPALSEREAADLVQRFCTKLIGVNANYNPNDPGGWPPNTPAVFGPLVTPDLAAMIEKGLARSAAFQEAGGGKPVLGDGVPWKWVQDAASECTAGSNSGPPEHPEVEIRYKYAGDPNDGWTDTLVLRRHRDEWRIDDIRYGDRGDDWRLRSVLDEAIKEEIP